MQLEDKVPAEDFENGHRRREVGGVEDVFRQVFWVHGYLLAAADVKDGGEQSGSVAVQSSTAEEEVWCCLLFLVTEGAALAPTCASSG